MKLLLGSLMMVCSALHGQDYQKIHRKAVLVDSHNDILTASLEKNVQIDLDLSGKTHSDLNRFNKAGIDVQLFSVWCDGEMKNPFAWAVREMDTLDAVIARNPQKIALVKNRSQLKKAIRKHQLAAMFGVEGGHMLENNINNLNYFYNRGARYMTLTWNNSTDWASSAKDETDHTLPYGKAGLSDFGKQVIQRMNQMGMLVDLSHVGEQTFKDAIALTTKPVLVSHSNAYALCPVSRNLKDDQIDAIGKNNGVIQLNFYSGFVDSNFLKKDSPAMRPPLSALLDHLDYIVRRIGVNHVGMGSDFDGISSTPKQLDDITAYPLITKALLERGYSKQDIYKIMGGNFLRVLKANEKQ